MCLITREEQCCLLAAHRVKVVSVSAACDPTMTPARPNQPSQESHLRIKVVMVENESEHLFRPYQEVVYQWRFLELCALSFQMTSLLTSIMTKTATLTFQSETRPHWLLAIPVGPALCIGCG